MNPTFNNLRKGHRYQLTNHGEIHNFEVIEIFSEQDCRLKDVLTMEMYDLNDLICYGIGSDFDLSEIR